MTDSDRDTSMRMAAFERVRRLDEEYDHLTAAELEPGFIFDGARIPLVHPQQGIFKPRQMRYLLSIKTAFPQPGAKVLYDDQVDMHRQIIENDEMVEYSFMGQDPEAAHNRWLLEALESEIPVVYFLGIAPGCYQTMFPAYIWGWDPDALKARVAFGVPEQDVLVPPDALGRRYGLRAVRRRLREALFQKPLFWSAVAGCALSGLSEQRLLDVAHTTCAGGKGCVLYWCEVLL